mmetsp:Transcript_5284/g.9614  ORF Transcript_5284/g.9614 Transcript_5284/m.9614 type:complete len:649 (-) Transcript_5284:46-1992(-)|eukprot:CAMPEP_0182496858 /NCGR_PEP_ID=MMETSP1321-20130603/5432_1 /TAXON_ID=91990 /ORGANISM="Bolidomonas sp., Strain RCC1657" /LENGTH=648 /DNA_ID=CAMNT_0024700577 /DNA_START=68 /DNA_END=2014 /DNA_ORIENTATION=-
MEASSSASLAFKTALNLSAASLDDSTSDRLLTKFQALASHHNLTASEMSDNWDAYSMSNDDAVHSESNFNAFRTFLTKALEKKSGTAKSGVAKSIEKKSAVVTKVDNKRKNSQVNPMGSPPSNSKAKLAAGITRVSTSPAAAYEDRKNVGQVVAHFNTQLDEKKVDLNLVTGGRVGPSISGLTDFGTNVSQKYRYMFTTLPERAQALDSHLVSLGKEMAGAFDMKDLCPIGEPRTDTVKVIGRVCNEAHEGKLNKTTVMLEGSRHEAGGQRIFMNCDELKTFSVFPGQVVGVEGKNPSGRKMIASKICEGVSKPMVKTKAGELLKLQHSGEGQDGQPLSVFAAAGPFTTNQNFDFEPMADLLAVVGRLRPDVVVLSGPFVPADHPAAKNGAVQMVSEDGEKLTVTFENIFSEKFAKLLEDTFLDHPDLLTQFVLVPSIDDAFHDNVFPQAPFKDRVENGESLDLPGAEGIVNGSLGLQYVEEAGREGQEQSTWTKRVHCVSNPCTFKINDVVFGITSVDPLFSLTTQDCSANINRMARMAQHLIQQQSYYPVFPPPKQANLDLRHLGKVKMPVTPDVLLVPSKLAPFCKEVLGSLVVNPQQLSKGSTGGTFATITIHPMPREELEKAGEGVEMPHKVAERARVQVQKI